MVIGIDGLVFQTKLTGVGKYYLGILNDLRKAIPDAEYLIFSNRELPFLPEEWAHETVILDLRISSKLKYIVWLKLFAGRLIKQYPVDFYFSCNTFIPTLDKRVRSIGIVHDLNYICAPETMPVTNYWAHKIFMKSDTKGIDFLLSNSIATEKKAARFLGVQVDEVINPKIDAQFKVRPAVEVKSYLKSVSIDYPFVLSVATLEPRKNIDKTIAAFLALKRAGELPGYKLVLAGGAGWKNEKLEALIESEKEHIVKLGYVSDELLAYLYNGAALFVFPSKYEGFGIPVREAIQSGCKVLASNIEELMEVGGTNAFYFDLQEAGSYEHALLMALKSPGEVYATFEHPSIKNLANFIQSGRKDVLNTRKP
jgi:glycosyltransferase involved in cell wall biosynthesis